MQRRDPGHQFKELLSYKGHVVNISHAFRMGLDIAAPNKKGKNVNFDEANLALSKENNLYCILPGHHEIGWKFLQHPKQLYFVTWIYNVFADPRLKYYTIANSEYGRMNVAEWLRMKGIPETDPMSGRIVQQKVQAVYKKLVEAGEVADGSPDGECASSAGMRTRQAARRTRRKIQEPFWVLNFNMDSSSGAPEQKYCIQKMSDVFLLQRVRDALKFLNDFVELTDDGNCVTVRRYGDEELRKLTYFSYLNPDHEDSLLMAPSLRSGTGKPKMVDEPGVAGELRLDPKLSRYIIDWRDLLENVQNAILAGPDPAAGPSSGAGPSS